MSRYSAVSYQGNDFNNYLSVIRKYPLLTIEEETLLTENVYLRQDMKSAQKLVMSHMKLVVKIAYEMKRYNLVLMDLISEGSIGLMHAVKKFNPSVGARFSSYATWWIKACIHEYIIKTWSLVKIGTTTGQKKLFFHLKKAKEKILTAHNKKSLSDLDCKTIASELSVSSREVKEMDLRLSGSISLDDPIGNQDENGVTVLDSLSDSKENTEHMVLNKDTHSKQRHLFNEALSTLSDREADIIKCRYLQDKGDTLAVLGKKYNISNERIRQIEKVALEKVTKHCRNNYL